MNVTKPTDLTRQTLQAFVIGLRQRGIKPVTCNTYAKAINAFLKWLHDEGHVSTLLVIPPQRTEKRVLQVLTEAQLRTLITFKAKNLAQHRAFTLTMLLMDTGRGLRSLQVLYLAFLKTIR